MKRLLSFFTVVAVIGSGGRQRNGSFIAAFASDRRAPASLCSGPPFRMIKRDLVIARSQRLQKRRRKPKLHLR
jgi:hypothetical protein